jgi:3-methyladenine DNA glycosylase/8-oxoguanine DNA glycosylase
MRPGKERLRVRIFSDSDLSGARVNEALLQLRSCFRLHEDLEPFYRYCRTYPEYRWISRSGAGRLLRAPNAFEDAIKMICTTNCSWSLTESMIGNLVTSLGASSSNGLHAFPTPERIASVSDAFMRKEIRAGYRSPYLIDLAESVASGKLNIESWRNWPHSTEALFQTMRGVKGIGAYAAGNLLKLAGRYDYLGLDSWVRSRYYALNHNGRRVSDRTIERRYAAHGEWRGLLIWLEMTQHWFKNKFPF